MKKVTDENEEIVQEVTEETTEEATEETEISKRTHNRKVQLIAGVAVVTLLVGAGATAYTINSFVNEEVVVEVVEDEVAEDAVEADSELAGQLETVVATMKENTVKLAETLKLEETSIEVRNLLALIAEFEGVESENINQELVDEATSLNKDILRSINTETYLFELLEVFVAEQAELDAEEVEAEEVVEVKTENTTSNTTTSTPSTSTSNNTASNTTTSTPSTSTTTDSNKVDVHVCNWVTTTEKVLVSEATTKEVPYEVDVVRSCKISNTCGTNLTLEYEKYVAGGGTEIWADYHLSHWNGCSFTTKDAVTGTETVYRTEEVPAVYDTVTTTVCSGCGKTK